MLPYIMLNFLKKNYLYMCGLGQGAMVFMGKSEDKF